MRGMRHDGADTTEHEMDGVRCVCTEERRGLSVQQINTDCVMKCGVSCRNRRLQNKKVQHGLLKQETNLRIPINMHEKGNYLSLI